MQHHDRIIDPHVAKLTSPEECEQFAINVADSHPDWVLQAKRRAVELRAERAGAKTAAEREALEAVYAYEAVLAERRPLEVVAMMAGNADRVSREQAEILGRGG